MNGNATPQYLNVDGTAEITGPPRGSSPVPNGLEANTTNGSSVDSKVILDVLVVGAGPAGLSLACFLGHHGIKGMVIGMHPSTARTPRAHYTNGAAFECLRDIGLEDEARRAGTDRENNMYYRFAESMAGEEYIRAYAFGNHPQRSGHYVDSSPCPNWDVPQNILEPILLKYATHHGFKARFDSRLVSVEEDESTGLVTSTIHDLVTQQHYQVVSKYVCGADGAKSKVAEQIGLKFEDKSTGALAINVWYEGDQSHITKHSPGLLHTLFTPHLDCPVWGIAGINRYIRPWKEWLMVLLSAPGITDVDVSEAELLERTRQLIGDDSVKIKLKGISKWNMHEAYALTYGKGHVYCLGDAVHRHPPGNGLGSNTCIQDAYNLAWKLAFVLKGKAAPSLLESYSLERQPIGKRIVRVANNAFQRHFQLYAALGIFAHTPAERMAALQELKSDTPEAAKRRQAVKAGHEGLEDERHGLGAELNQAYESGAIYADDEATPIEKWWEAPDRTSEGIKYHVPSTEPGARLPHAWLKTARLGQQLSTHDLAGKDHFTIFTGIGGTDTWTAAAKAATNSLGVEVKTYTIGWGREYGDIFWMWEERRGVAEDGCVLVRPDRTVLWRCNSVMQSGAEDKVISVIKRVLGF